jgi:hypothetical protein
LGLETLNLVTDKYYDTVHDNLAHIGPWIHDQRERSLSKRRKHRAYSAPNNMHDDYPRPPSRANSRRDEYDDDYRRDDRGRHPRMRDDRSDYGRYDREPRSVSPLSPTKTKT